jgi:hypothetical protein
MHEWITVKICNDTRHYVYNRSDFTLKSSRICAPPAIYWKSYRPVFLNLRETAAR